MSLLPEQVIDIHNFLVEKFKDSEDPISPPGVKNLGSLESAVARPFHTAHGKDVFPSLFNKGAALFHSLIHNHPFHNGNKRTALIALLVFLDRQNYWLDLCSDDELFDVTRQIAAHEFSEERGHEVQDISEWLEANSRKRTKGEKPLSYHELRSILQRFGFTIDPPDSRFLNIYRDGVRIERITKEGIQGFRPYHTDYISGLRKRLNLTPEYGIDSEMFYGRVDNYGDLLSELVSLRIDVIKKLATT